MGRTLIICIGNNARGDDGVARRTAELLKVRLPADTTLVSRPQLDIVMTDLVADADLVVFADAERRHKPLVEVRDLVPDTAHSNAHALDPGGLLALANTLYSATPVTRLVSIAAPEMGHSEGLSATGKAASEEAAFAILRLLKELG